MNACRTTSLTLSLLLAAVAAGGLPARSPAAPPDAEVGKLAGDALEHPDKRVRLKALERLGEMGPRAKGASARLAPLLKDPDDDVRKTAGVTLGQVGGVKELTAALADKDSTVRYYAAQGLKFAGAAGKPAVPHLRKLLRDEQNVRYIALSTLFALDPADRDTLRDMAAFIKDGAVEKRWKIYLLQDVGTLGPRAEPAVPVLVGVLKDPSLGPWAVHPLGRIGPAARPAVPALLDMLRYRDPVKGPLLDVLGRTLTRIVPPGAERHPRLDEELPLAHRAVTRRMLAELHRPGGRGDRYDLSFNHVVGKWMVDSYRPAYEPPASNDDLAKMSRAQLAAERKRCAEAVDALERQTERWEAEMKFHAERAREFARDGNMTLSGYHGGMVKGLGEQARKNLSWVLAWKARKASVEALLAGK